MVGVMWEKIQGPGESHVSIALCPHVSKSIYLDIFDKALVTIVFPGDDPSGRVNVRNYIEQDLGPRVGDCEGCNGYCATHSAFEMAIRSSILTTSLIPKN